MNAGRDALALAAMYRRDAETYALDADDEAFYENGPLAKRLAGKSTERLHVSAVHALEWLLTPEAGE